MKTMMAMMMKATWLKDDEPMAEACEWARSKACCASGGTPVLVWTQPDQEEDEEDVEDVDKYDEYEVEELASFFCRNVLTWW